MQNFKDLAKRQTTLSEVMLDREKVTTEELMEKYPGGVTIIAFDYITSRKSIGI